MKAYLLAAGYATRLHPLTRDFPKPLLEVGGRPILSRIVERIAELGSVSECVVISNGSFAEHFRTWADAQQTGFPIHVLDDGTHGEEERLGAIGDLAFALAESPPRDEDWLVAAGDNLLEFDLRALHAEFARVRTPLLALREREPEPGPSRYNEVHVDASGRVTAFREKPAAPTSPLAAIAFYLYPAATAPLVSRYLAQGGNPDAPGHFVEWLVGTTSVHGARLAGEWFDIGTHDTLAAARQRFGG